MQINLMYYIIACNYTLYLESNKNKASIHVYVFETGNYLKICNNQFKDYYTVRYYSLVCTANCYQNICEEITL